MSLRRSASRSRRSSRPARHVGARSSPTALECGHARSAWSQGTAMRSARRVAVACTSMSARVWPSKASSGISRGSRVRGSVVLILGFRAGSACHFLYLRAMWCLVTIRTGGEVLETRSTHVEAWTKRAEESVMQQGQLPHGLTATRVRLKSCS